MPPDYKLFYSKKVPRNKVVSTVKKFTSKKFVHERIKEDLKKYEDWFEASRDGDEEGDGKMEIFLGNGDLMQIQQTKLDKNQFWVFVGTQGGNPSCLR